MISMREGDLRQIVKLITECLGNSDRKGVDIYRYGATDTDGLVCGYKLLITWRRHDAVLYRYRHPKPTVKARQCEFVGRITGTTPCRAGDSAHRDACVSIHYKNMDKSSEISIAVRDADCALSLDEEAKK